MSVTVQIMHTFSRNQNDIFDLHVYVVFLNVVFPKRTTVTFVAHPPPPPPRPHYSQIITMCQQ